MSLVAEPHGAQRPETVAATSGAVSPIEHFASVVDRQIGVQLAGKEYLIESRLNAVARDCAVGSVVDLLAAIQAGDRSLEKLAVEAMTTNETSFFRDQHPFTALAEAVLPEIAERNDGRLTIWNGACSSGQESYTLAMLIAEHLPDSAVHGRTRIVSTDVSPKMVERTRRGEYSSFEMNRGLPEELAARYFVPTGRKWVVTPSLRAMVRPSEVNLLGPWTDVPRSDVVMLRNVLIYFTMRARREVLRRIRTEILKPGGCLVLGASETTVGIDASYESRHFGSSIFYFPAAS